MLDALACRRGGALRMGLMLVGFGSLVVVLGGGLRKEEEDVVKGFAGPVWQWICGRGWGSREEWAGSDAGGVRLLSKHGETGVWRDGMWQQGLRVWDVGRKAVRDEHRKEAKL